MSLSDFDIIRVRSEAVLFGEKVINVYFYQTDGVTGLTTLEGFNDLFISEVLGNIVAIQHEDLAYQRVVSENLTNGLDFSETVYQEHGALTSFPPLPSYVAITYKLVRSTRLTRNGSKRFAGITEDAITDNEVVLNPVLLQQVAGALETQLEIEPPEGGPAYFTPVIVGRLPSGAIDLTKINAITDCVWKTTASTQNSRKPGAGA